MAGIETARGPIDSSCLGRVLIHEHVFLMDMEYTYNYRPDFFEDDTILNAAARLNELKATGIDTIIDLTVLGLGRHMPSLQKVSAMTDLNIIVSTGAYTFNDVPAPFQFYGPGLLRDAPEEPLVEHFVRDITQGIAGTGIKAGMLKCAIDMPGLTPGVERIMRAVARAHMLTGVPITVHTAPQAETGLIVQRVLTAKDLREARRGTMFAGYLKLAPVFIFLLPGMIAVALYKQGVAGFESIGTNPQGAFPVLVSNLLPVGLRGLVLAGMLSALMSALASLFRRSANANAIFTLSP